ncbi:Gfo/Idh/MocA family oxidoreductase [Parahaliea aestuarii]
MGMVGGGEGAFIGAVHRMAAALDGQVELVCGSFSSDAERSARSGAALGLPAARCYADFASMMRSEAALPAEQRMEFVAVVTPNHLHLPVVKAALASGFHVFSDKPATFDLNEARELQALVSGSGLHYALSHTYVGYAMVQEARRRVLAGELGRVRKVVVEYSQGWLAGDAGEDLWRLDPARSGASCCMGDIGTHAFNLAETVTGLKIAELSSDIGPLVPGRQLDDDGTALLRFENGARGVLIASQVSVGEENNLSVRVYGERAGLEWRQQEPNSLILKSNEGPAQVLRAGWPGLGDGALALGRIPAGHPEGYLEAFANLYRAFAAVVRGEADNGFHLPGLDEAFRGMAFVDTAVASSAAGGQWRAIPVE